MPRAPTSTPIAQARAAFGRPAQTLLWLLDWIPARLTALSFAIVGDFEDAVFCWRTQAKSWVGEEGGEHAGIVLASGAGALGVLLGGPIPVVGARARRYGPSSASANCLTPTFFRAPSGSSGARSCCGSLLMLLLTLANWAP